MSFINMQEIQPVKNKPKSINLSTSDLLISIFLGWIDWDGREVK